MTKLYRYTGCRACDFSPEFCDEHWPGQRLLLTLEPINYTCRTCRRNRGSIHLRSQECPDCKATRIGHCLCSSDPSHPDEPCTTPATWPSDDGLCAPCRNFRENND